MDSGRGHMEEIPDMLYEMATEKYKEESGVFKVGEKLEIKGSVFKVKKITPFGILLKVLKSEPKY